MSESKIVLVFSDSHGSTSKMIAIAKKEQPDLILHLGDHASDGKEVEKETGIRVVAVKGNCDIYGDEPDTEEVYISGNKLVLTHGHKYGAKYSYDRVFYLGKEMEAAAIFFGHSHVPVREYADGLWVVNPGSIALPRNGIKTYAKCMIGEYGIVPKIIEI